MANRASAFFKTASRKAVKAGVQTPGLEFAVKYDMLLPEEIKSIQEGNMHYKQSTLMNLNADRNITKIKTGETVRLYSGRATTIKALRLIGRDV